MIMLTFLVMIAFVQALIILITPMVVKLPGFHAKIMLASGVLRTCRTAFFAQSAPVAQLIRVKAVPAFFAEMILPVLSVRTKIVFVAVVVRAAVFAFAAVLTDIIAFAAALAAVCAKLRTCAAVFPTVFTDADAVTAKNTVGTVRARHGQALPAVMAVQVIVHGAVMAHLTFVTVASAAFVTMSALFALDGISKAFHKTVSAVFTGRALFQMTLQTGIVTTAVALSGAVKAAFAQHTPVIGIHMLPAVRAMISGIDRAIVTQDTLLTPFVTGRAYIPASVAQKMVIHQTLAAVRAGKILFQMTLQTQMGMPFRA